MAIGLSPVVVVALGLLVVIPQGVSFFLSWTLAPRVHSAVAAVLAAALFVILATLVVNRVEVLSALQRVLRRETDLFPIGGLEFSFFGRVVGALLNALLAGAISRWVVRISLLPDAL